LGTLGAQDVYTLNSNLTDPLALHKQAIDGSKVDYYGTKDPTGLMTQMYAARVTDPTGKATSWSFDSLNRPTQLMAANGTALQLSWQTNNQAPVTAVSPDGSVALTVPYTFQASSTASTAWIERPAASAPSPASAIQVIVSGCSPTELIDGADVYLNYQQLGDQAETIPAIGNGGGTGAYVAQVPTPSSILSDVAALGQSVKNAIQPVCDQLDINQVTSPQFDTAVCSAVLGASVFFHHLSARL
jgi:TPP-dependent trihydroxycyclohexane-1,2-dione (THcHDO) dehydratase